MITTLKPQPLSDTEIRNMLSRNNPGQYTCAIRADTDEYLVSVGESKKYDVIVEYFVDTITSKFDQDISLLLVGNKGRGKSRAALSLCYYAGCELAERKGGRWDDYFDPETNMAIISPIKASAVMGVKNKFAVKNFDDIGIGWGARNWQKKENIEKGEVFQINRIDSQLQVFSVPNQFLLDKIPRSLVSHYAEMDQQFFDYGFTTMKLFKPMTLFREGRIIQPYLYTNRVKYVLYRIPKPPEFLDKIYTKLRKDATREAISERLKAKGEHDGYKRIPAPAKGLAVIHKKLPRETIEEFRPMLSQIMADGGTRKDITNYLNNEQNISRERLRYWWKAGYFTEMHLDPLHGAPLSGT
jgi:hypothetical protein